ncbi:hypothetical protein ACFVYP_40965 [Kitasatospora sp. NPDC058201]|uniref:hypothetical protein n=1 Tax=unclassified Kitasatospora TaxID=2633591 RepID=UPI0036542BD7
MTLENWADLGTTLAAVATLVLVGFGAWQLKALGRQVRLGREATDAAVRAADAAQAAVKESARARIDAAAPRIVVLAEEPAWPPFIDRTRPSMPYRNGVRMFDSMALHAVEVAGRSDWVFPEHDQFLMWFRLRAVVTNEGTSTARIMLNGEGRFIEDESPLIPGRTLPCPPVVGVTGDSYLGREHALRPGESGLFEWAVGVHLGQWAADRTSEVATSISMQLSSVDGYSVMDSIQLELSGSPLEHVPQREGHWRLSDRAGSSVNVTAHQTYRRYRHEMAEATAEG